MTLKTYLTAIIFFSYVFSVNASKCIVIGDSQSAISIQNMERSKRGLVPTLKQGLESMGHTAHFYAIKGSGAKDWIYSPKENRNTLIGKAPSDKDNVSDQNEFKLTPFQLNNLPQKLTLSTGSNKTFVDQVFDFHQLEDIDCFLIQLGDNDIFREDAAQYMSELVKHILGKDKSPRLCAVVAPSLKESDNGKKNRDQFPFITNTKKLAYITQVRHHLQKNKLLDDCPIISTITPQLDDELKSLDKNFTYDGLFYNSLGGEVWAKNILKASPLSVRR